MDAIIFFKIQIVIQFDEVVQGPLYVYYELTNYYQNNRRYIKSTSQSQLLGQVHFNLTFYCLKTNVRRGFQPDLYNVTNAC